MPRRPPENTLTTRTAFFAHEEDAWRALTATWEDVPEATLLLAGACGTEWSVKDVMNHIDTWQEAATRVIRDLLNGKWGRLGSSTDKFNAQHYTVDRDRPLTESHERLVRARQNLLLLLATVADDDLLNEYGRQQIGWWAKWATYAHYHQHLGDLTSFRQQRHHLRSDSPER